MYRRPIFVLPRSNHLTSVSPSISPSEQPSALQARSLPAFMRPDRPRSPLAGPSTGPTAPFPIRLSGPVVKGFGRGSKELGIPTANIPLAGLSVGGHEDVESGVYYGWAGVDVDNEGNRIEIESHEGGDGKEGNEGKQGQVWAMVMSIGFNPYYNNTVRSVEVHILHSFPQDFYGARMNLLMLGFIRPEYDYVSKGSLIEDIRIDIEVARRSLERGAYQNLKTDEYLLRFEGEGHENEVAS